MSIGLGLVFVPITNVALYGIDPDDSGVASGVVNATQQIGGSIGTGLLNSIAISAGTAYLDDRGGTAAGAEVIAEAAVHSYSVVFLASAALLLVGAVISALLVSARAEDLPSDAQPVIA